jgi:predicted AlkP superfamily phosphohydrolase/phosphomutase
MKSLVIGLDAFDPLVFERLFEQGRMPVLGKYVQTGGYSRFAISNPPQSEVSWTSIATGANPGSHGLFDFVHRDPETYSLSVSLLPTQSSLFGSRFVPPTTAKTLFDQVTRQGFPSTALWWPATFPARIESPVRTIPGLGTPDIQGRLGVGSMFTTETCQQDERLKTPVEPLQQRGKGRFSGSLKGPVQKKGRGVNETTCEFVLEISGHDSGRLIVGKNEIPLVAGQWSPIFVVSFKAGRFVSVKAITRAILTHTQPDIRLYFLPLQIHPLHSPWRYAAPQSLARDTWNSSGPFLTLGWPQDTTGLEEGWINDEQFLDLCSSIVDQREKILMYHLRNFNEGVFASVFDTLDRVQHMFWRDRPDLIEQWYLNLDALIGRIEAFIQTQGKDKTRLIVVSDHGFANFDYKVHLNRWLIDQGYLIVNGNGQKNRLSDADWSSSKAYAIGLNSLYLNLQGREGQGCVAVGEREQVCQKLRSELLDWIGPDGRPVVRRVWLQNEALEGPLAEYGPDLLVGFSDGYRASSQTGLGAWEREPVERNRDHWGADHCIDPEMVPGVIFSNQGLQNFPNPSYREFPAIAVGMNVEPGKVTPPPSQKSDEDQEVIEERLKSLGYL